MLSDELLFTNDDETDLEEELLAAWTVLVVDDEREVHAVTRMVLADFVFEQRPVNIITASSAAEARDILLADKHNAIAVAIIDVEMETTQAGLELVRWVRETLRNHLIRLILRTGQPGEAPE
jgi:CheY-like chemotaxis protein